MACVWFCHCESTFALHQTFALLLPSAQPAAGLAAPATARLSNSSGGGLLLVAHVGEGFAGIPWRYGDQCGMLAICASGAVWQYVRQGDRFAGLVTQLATRQQRRQNAKHRISDQMQSARPLPLPHPPPPTRPRRCHKAPQILSLQQAVSAWAQHRIELLVVRLSITKRPDRCAGQPAAAAAARLPAGDGQGFVGRLRRSSQ